MTKLPSNIKANELIKYLVKAGFNETGRRGSHIHFRHPDGRWTQVAVHQKPIPQGTLRAILRQIKVEPREFKI